MKMVKVVEIQVLDKRIPIAKFKQDLTTAVQMCFYNEHFLSKLTHYVDSQTQQEYVAMVRSLEEAITNFSENITCDPEDWIKRELSELFLERGYAFDDEHAECVADKFYYKIEEILGLLN